MEADAKEPTGVTRGQKSVQVMPLDWSAAEQVLATLVDRIDPARAETQLLVVTADAENAAAAAEAIVSTIGSRNISVMAATASPRAARLLKTAAAHVITSVGRGWRWASHVAVDWVPFAVLLYAYDRSYGFATRFGRPVLIAPLVGADKLLFAGQVPAVWVQQHISHTGGVAWWELAVTIVYASHFVLPFALAGALWWPSRRLWRRG